MTDLAVTMRVTTKHGNAAIKAGGAGAQAGAVDGLEGAFAAILDAAATAKVAVPGVVSAEGAVSAEMLAAAAAKAVAAAGASAETVAEGQGAQAELLARQAALVGKNGIQIKSIAKKADEPVAEDMLAEGEAATADLAETTDAKPRKAGARVKNENAATDPAALQVAVAAAVAATGQAAVQAPDQPAPTTKDLLAIDADGRAGGSAQAALVVPALAKQTKSQAAIAETTDTSETGVTSPMTPSVLPAMAEARTAPAPAPVKADAQPQDAQIAAQAGTASAEDNGNPQSGAKGGDEEKSSADIIRIASKAANDDSVTATADPFQSIIDSLPPVVQSQMNVQGLGGTDAVTQTASTGELLGNQVIDMSVSGQWIDRMAREIAKLSEGTGHSRFQLMPPNLGRIQVDLWQGEDKTNVRLLTETDEAARRLREGQSALEASARLASISLGSVSVEKSSTSAESNRDQNGGQNQRQQAENGDNGQQQASAQAQSQGQGQAGQGRRNTGTSNVGSFSAVMGFEQQAESEQSVRAPRADDPRIRFA